MRPTEEFGPRNPSDKERWKLFKRGIIVNGGAGPDLYQLPAGETRSNNNLPSWLTILEDGQVLAKKDVMNDPDLLALRRVDKEEQSMRSNAQSGEGDLEDDDFASVVVSRK